VKNTRHNNIINNTYDNSQSRFTIEIVIITKMLLFKSEFNLNKVYVFAYKLNL